LSLIGWGISHDSLTALLNFNFSFEASDATAGLTASSDPASVFRYYLFPHYFMYASMPVYIAMGLMLMYATYRNAPWHAFVGAICSIIGGVYFIGVLGAFLSIPIGTVVVTNLLALSFGLCILVFVGNILLGISLYKSGLSSKRASLLFILGNVLILGFPGIENWMALGSLLMLIAMLPLATRILKRKGAVEVGA
jgi:hypothetical protein